MYQIKEEIFGSSHLSFCSSIVRSCLTLKDLSTLPVEIKKEIKKIDTRCGRIIWHQYLMI